VENVESEKVLVSAEIVGKNAEVESQVARLLNLKLRSRGCEVAEVLENVKAAEEENDCETMDDCESDFLAIDVNCEDWA